MAKTLRCAIVTPSEPVFDGDIEYASIPAWDGQLGVMAGQSPLLTRLGVGSLRIDSLDGESRFFLLDSGFGQVSGDQLTLITEDAIPAENLTVAEADAELAEANARVTVSGEDRAQVERDQQRAMAKKALAGMSVSGR